MKQLLLILFIIISLSADNLTISVKKGSFFKNTFKSGLIPVKSFPQIAIWIEEQDETFIRSLFVTKKTAENSYKKNLDGSRKSSLPIWMHKRDIKNSSGGYWPTKDAPLPDAISGATPKTDFSKNFNISNDEIKRGVILRVEVNNANDFNDSYHENVHEGSEFNNNNVNGQPSLVYQISLSEKLYGGEFELHLEGSGSASGNSGYVNWEAPEVTTAKEIIKRITGKISK